ncbi:unnamed protein product [Tetraodon nigroviridis]|uniref:Chromosome 2 SCAF14738, whole genome shotgun sequence n=1 Tax=Tetraodon nigroviridis TaxID=99883 RepID=Q4S4B7_TETNG|nr:unnamed protein product [Tetraodon nigroviridis]
MRRGDTTPGFSAQKTTDLCSTFLPKKWYIVAKRRKRLQSGNFKMDSFNRSTDSSLSAESPGGLNQGFLLHPDNPIHSSTPSIIPDTPSPQPSKRRRSERKRRLNPVSQ